MSTPGSNNTSDILLQFSNEITDAIGVCQHSLNQLIITPELLSLNCQKSSLAAAKAEFVLDGIGIPEDLTLKKAIVEKEMVFVKCATQCLKESNAASRVNVSLLRQELECAKKEYWSIQKELDEKDQKQLKYFVMKQDEYVRRAVVLKEKIISNGITDIGQYQSVIDHSKNVSRSQAQLREVSKMLTKYANLPPNIQGAKLKLTEAKENFKELDQKLYQKIVADI